jgi:C-terminal processing protease CtpA/Prc
MNRQCIEDVQRLGFVALPTVRIGVNFTVVTMVIDRFPVGSLAEAAGVRVGDRLTRLHRHEIRGYADMATVMNTKKAGDTVTLTLDRAGETIVIPVVAIAETK